eukprot:357762-Chlamydomonas_euryale.AAC.5
MHVHAYAAGNAAWRLHGYARHRMALHGACMDTHSTAWRCMELEWTRTAPHVVAWSSHGHAQRRMALHGARMDTHDAAWRCMELVWTRMMPHGAAWNSHGHA